MDILRFLTAGSVDDGKSTLIGRLLYDSTSIMQDQLETITQQSRNNGAGALDLALFTDGLRAEREQGITIDVAYKYFATPLRKFIVADAPGHIQYTRNMVTGASNTDLAIILIDARNGVVEQTVRHSLLASLLGVPHIVVAINKMDTVAYAEQVYNTILSHYTTVAETLGITNVVAIPISALHGDNIVEKSTAMPWYTGAPLLHTLEHVEVRQHTNLANARFPVQYVIRPQTTGLPAYRGYAGKIISGVYRKGDKVTILPSGAESAIKSIEVHGNEVAMAFAPQSAVLRLDTAVDVSRGDMIVHSDNQPLLSNELHTLLCWMETTPLRIGDVHLLQINSRVVKSIVQAIHYRIDVHTMQREYSPAEVRLNDIVKVTLKTAAPVPYDSYGALRANGNGILINENSNATVGACILQ